MNKETSTENPKKVLPIVERFSVLRAIRKGMQWMFRKPVTWAADKFSSDPVKEDVFSSLDSLLKEIRDGKKEKGLHLPFDLEKGKYIVFSDQHKGARDLADDFMLAEKNYIAALDYYFEQGYTLICLGDSEELWENEPLVVLKNYKDTLESELRFLKDDRFIKIFGNHDLEWSYRIPQFLFLKSKYGHELKIYEGFLITTQYNNKNYDIFMAHGHQGDQRSDGNAFSKWFVAAIWTPIQRFLEIKSNTPAKSFELGDKHNIIMYEWSAAQKNLLFISGHTHKPVFASMDHIDRLNKKLEKLKADGDTEGILKVEQELKNRQLEYAGKQFHKTMVIPSYFNSGCCCYSDGIITGLEISDGEIRLIKWSAENDNNVPARKILEYSSLRYVFDELNTQ